MQSVERDILCQNSLLCVSTPVDFILVFRTLLNCFDCIILQKISLIPNSYIYVTLYQSDVRPLCLKAGPEGGVYEGDGGLADSELSPSFFLLRFPKAKCLRDLLNIRNIRPNHHRVIRMVNDNPRLGASYFLHMLLLNIVDFNFIGFFVLRIMCR